MWHLFRRSQARWLCEVTQIPARPEYRVCCLNSLLLWRSGESGVAPCWIPTQVPANLGPGLLSNEAPAACFTTLFIFFPEIVASGISTTKWAHQHCLVRIFFTNRQEITFHAKDSTSCMAPTVGWGRGGMSLAERVELFLLWDSINCQMKSVSKWLLEAGFLGRHAIDWTRPEWSFFWEDKILYYHGSEILHR